MPARLLTSPPTRPIRHAHDTDPHDPSCTIVSRPRRDERPGRRSKRCTGRPNVVHQHDESRPRRQAPSKTERPGHIPPSLTGWNRPLLRAMDPPKPPDDPPTRGTGHAARQHEGVVDAAGQTTTRARRDRDDQQRQVIEPQSPSIVCDPLAEHPPQVPPRPTPAVELEIVDRFAQGTVVDAQANRPRPRQAFASAGRAAVGVRLPWTDARGASRARLRRIFKFQALQACAYLPAVGARVEPCALEGVPDPCHGRGCGVGSGGLWRRRRRCGTALSGGGRPRRPTKLALADSLAHEMLGGSPSCPVPRCVRSSSARAMRRALWGISCPRRRCRWAGWISSIRWFTRC